MPRRGMRRALLVTAGYAAAAVALASALAAPEAGPDAEIAHTTGGLPGFPGGLVVLTFLLLSGSAFFSACEVAFFSLHKLRLRALRESTHFLDRLVGRLMLHPGDLLTSILMGNSIVNVSLSVVLAVPVESWFRDSMGLPEPAAYAGAVAAMTFGLVFFGEVMPKVLVVRQNEAFARLAAVPILCVDRVISPLRKGMLLIVGFLFRVTRFSELRPAPFMTDGEFKSLISDSEALGVIETDERKMIQGILELRDVMVREILVPRPDIVALAHTATVGEALSLFRQHEFSRMPVYEDDLDHIIGTIYAKDLLPSMARGMLDAPVTALLRKAHFVPETMSVADFVKSAQQVRAHLAIVVDEYGGTEGLVTLQDALSEVVGDLGEEEEAPPAPYAEIGEGEYLVDGDMDLDALAALTGAHVDDEEHTTVAGFLMRKTEKLPETGVEIEHDGVAYRVVEMEGRRVAKIRVHITKAPAAEARL